MADAPRDPEVLPALPGALAPVPVARATDRALGRADTLTAYMAELAHHAPIDRRGQRLARRWAGAGLEAARRQAREPASGGQIAMEYRRAWVNVLDLIQSGNVAVEAVQRFDPYQA
jgi:DNA-directed RNA polymerase sigma subunit (sigma70/sigma32)